MAKEHRLRIGKNKFSIGFARHAMYAGMLNEGKEFSTAISYGCGMFNLYYPADRMEIEISGRKFKVVRVTQEELILRG